MYFSSEICSKILLFRVLIFHSEADCFLFLLKLKRPKNKSFFKIKNCFANQSISLRTNSSRLAFGWLPLGIWYKWCKHHNANLNPDAVPAQRIGDNYSFQSIENGIRKKS